MVTYKCKICGGDINATEGDSVVICGNCGTKQTVSLSADEQIVNLFNRANSLRLKYEFDRATETYEKILDIDNTQAEAHWGVVLCKYGIQYVDSNDDGEEIRRPTCHRTQLDSILSDVDYLSTLKYADFNAKLVYKAEAGIINDLQKKILDIVKREDPFDVFICYKDRDDDNNKTRDSVIANEIYHELTNEGLKVFFAAISLEDKFGEEYEPYIYAALSSAKVMLVIGTKPEYFKAVWVKNEWSRYLYIMKMNKDQKRRLIPCYKEMDAYDLPDEFAHLQALDMSNIAFINDLVRSIKKQIEGTAENIPAEKRRYTSNIDTDLVSPLIKRAYLSLEDGEFEAASQILDKALDLDPENAKAYTGLLMIDCHVRKESDLCNLKTPLSQNRNFQKACRFADEKYHSQLLDYNKKVEINIKEGIYWKAKADLSAGKYIEASNSFNKIIDYKDSKALSLEALNQHNRKRYAYGLELMERRDYPAAQECFQRLAGTFKDAADLAKQCSTLQHQLELDREQKELQAQQEMYEEIYKRGQKLLSDKDYRNARTIFSSIIEYKDTKQLLQYCDEQISETERDSTYHAGIDAAKNKRYDEAEKLFSSIKGYKNADALLERAIKCRNSEQTAMRVAAGSKAVVIVFFKGLKNFIGFGILGLIAGFMLYGILFWVFLLTGLINAGDDDPILVGSIIFCEIIAAIISWRLAYREYLSNYYKMKKRNL